jgi:oxygen-independent coproporphyrinogen-3 oxidase
MTGATTGLGLYIHIPFCRSKCDYCAFVSYPVGKFKPAAYLTALHREINFWSKRTRAARFDSLFIGGGTPTILPTAELIRLLAVVRDRFAIASDAEITIESNPNTIDRDKLTALLTHGVNRLSIGIQSFNDPTLRRINRSHTAAEGRAAISLARTIGFNNLNLDLIYGLPGQTVAEWQETLSEAVALAPDHLAIYQLSVDPGSRFAAQIAQGCLLLPDDDEVATMAENSLTTMAASPLVRYEISNYARPGRRCRHNLIYWRNGSYLGLGAGAVANWAGLRIRNTPDPDLYQARLRGGEPAWLEGEALPRAASFRETVIMGLRLMEGVAPAELQERFKLDFADYYGAILRKLTDRQLLEFKDDRWRLTEVALPFANQVLAELV